MFFIQFEVTPRRNTSTDLEFVGAFVNCWIERSTLEEAVQAARSNIASLGWIVSEPDKAHIVDASTYRNGKSGREQYEQALIDKEVFTFYRFPE